MSVVNDILNDLHNRQRQQRINQCIPFVYDDETETNGAHIVLKISIIFITIIVLAFIFNRYSQSIFDGFQFFYKNISGIEKKTEANITPQPKKIIVELPSKEPGSKAEYVNPITDFVRMPIKGESSKYSEIHNDKKFKLESDKKIVSKVISDVIKKTRKPLTVSVDDINSDITKKSVEFKIKNDIQERAISKSRKSVKDEADIQYWMNNSPEKIWPYIKASFPNAYGQASLLALGAQGEQRSAQHKNAIELYQRLLQLEPDQSKWYAGMAMSLDALGEHSRALVIYQKSKSLGGLPEALDIFVVRRMVELKRRGSHE